MSKKKLTENELYDYGYPSFLSNSSRFWFTQEGDQLEKEGVLYTVAQIIRLKIEGAKPMLVIEAQEKND